ncbi:hypothetical protein B0H14DRAFT_2560466 [Mycena olivaceomarginata]|nr:hypothetical protein B0H14DRAFT_2560466 [Mycena olivaceomarginata]
MRVNDLALLATDPQVATKYPLCSIPMATKGLRAINQLESELHLSNLVLAQMSQRLLETSKSKAGPQKVTIDASEYESYLRFKAGTTHDPTSNPLPARAKDTDMGSCSKPVGIHMHHPQLNLFILSFFITANPRALIHNPTHPKKVHPNPNSKERIDASALRRPRHLALPNASAHVALRGGPRTWSVAACVLCAIAARARRRGGARRRRVCSATSRQGGDEGLVVTTPSLEEVVAES